MIARRETNARKRRQKGMTFIELMMAILIFGVVMLVINRVFFTTNRIYTNTVVRAGQQMSTRAGLAMMVTELRTAGCDPEEDGIAALVTAAGDSVHFQSDYNGDRAITTAEPSETVLYYYDPNAMAIMRDPGTGPQAIINNVVTCTFTYFDENNDPVAQPMSPDDMELVRSVGITVTTRTDRGGTITTDTRVGLRNG